MIDPRQTLAVVAWSLAEQAMWDQLDDGCDANITHIFQAIIGTLCDTQYQTNREQPDDGVTLRFIVDAAYEAAEIAAGEAQKFIEAENRRLGRL